MGSVIEAPKAPLYMAYGTDFVGEPSLHPETARLCNWGKIAHAPGCGSASEIAQAVEIVKAFPGSSVGGPGFVRMIFRPSPWTRIMPTAGVGATETSIKGWFAAGVAVLGWKLITKQRGVLS